MYMCNYIYFYIQSQKIDRCQSLEPLDFRPFRQELEVCYLGRDIGSEKVAWLPPEDPRSQVRPGAPQPDPVMG